MRKSNLAPLLLTSLIFSTGVVLPNQTSLAVPPPQVTAPLTTQALPASVDQAVRQQAAKQFNVPISEVRVVSFTLEQWTDGCLGLGSPLENCLQAITEGWRVEVTNEEQNWIYRTNKTASSLRFEPQPSPIVLPPNVLQRLLPVVARQVNVPQNRLTVASVRSKTWESCQTGLFKRECRSIPGWQVIVNSPDLSWVYDLDESATRIVQNRTASGSRGGLVPAFIPEENKMAIENNVVFRSSVSGDMTGRLTQLTLTKDGLLTKLVTAPNIRSRPVVVKRLSQQQVAQFQQVLKAQQFRKLNDLSYLSSAAFADYPTTTLQGADGTVQYIDLELKNLPRAFQTVIQAWERLAVN